MIKRNILRVFTLLAFTSCAKNPKGDSFRDFFSETEIVNLSGEAVQVDDGGSPLAFMFNMTVMEGLIIVNEFLDPEYTYKLIDLRDGSVRKFGKKGDGPNELLSDAFYFSYDRNSRQLYLTDNIYYYVYALGDLKSGRDTPLYRFRIDQNDRRFMGSMVFSNGKIVGGTYQKRFSAYDIEDGFFVDTVEYEGGASQALANQATFLNHPTQNKTTYYMTRHEEFGIVTVQENALIPKVFSWNKIKHEVVEDSGTMTFVPNREVKYEFASATVSDRYIYLLYTGKQVENNSREAHVEAALSNEVFVVDWDGNPVRRLILDKRIRSIAVDDNDQNLYASSYEENPKLIVFKL